MKEKDISPDDLAPDIYRLEEEWARQSTLVKRHHDELADLRLAYDEAKQQAEEVEAEVQMDVRRSPSKYHIDKVTEATVEAATTLDLRVREARRDVILAKHAVAKKEGTVSALEHKKKSLEKCVDLFLAGYYAEPRPQSRAARDQRNEAEMRGAFGSGKPIPTREEK